MPETTQIALLSMEHLEAAHEEVAHLFEEDSEPMPAWHEGDITKLETLCHCTEVEGFGVQKYPDFHVKVAKLFYSGVKLHCFPNGNKRFALMVTILFLILNGYRLAAEPGSPSTIAKLVANSDPHTPAGKPDTVISLIADAYFKDIIKPRDEAND